MYLDCIFLGQTDDCRRNAKKVSEIPRKRSPIFCSIPLLILCTLGGSVGSLSVVTMIPFASLYNTNMISAMSTGMGKKNFLTQFFKFCLKLKFKKVLLECSPEFLP